MRKILAMALVVCVVAALLTGCGGNAQKIIGEWSVAIDVSDVAKRQLGPDFAGMDVNFPLTFIFGFEDDGTFKMSLDKEAAMETMTQFFTVAVDYTIELEASKQGMTSDEFKNIIKENTGIDIVELFWEDVSELNIEDLIGDVDNTGTYKVDGDKLYTAESGDVFLEEDVTIIEFPDNNTLRFVSTQNDEMFEEMFTLPLDFKKIG